MKPVDAGIAIHERVDHTDGQGLALSIGARAPHQQVRAVSRTLIPGPFRELSI
jgi:hypothetical protein